VAALPAGMKKPEVKKVAKNTLFEKRSRNFSIGMKVYDTIPYINFTLHIIVGQDIQPKRDLTRFVRWPKYIRLQREKAVLQKRLKIPPTINQFNQTLDKPNGFII
jgi:large subunit ribosomal protein L7Ae